MFWDKGYTPSQNIEVLLQKEDATVEDFLDDDDIIQECKAQKRNLVQYFTRPDVIKRLIELIITEPPEELPIAQRFKHASMACEILTLGLPSLNEKLVEDTTILKALYSYLEQEPPLNPLLSSFFNKTFCMLIWKKFDQDWFLYQKMCLQLLEFIKSQGNFIDLILKHFATPVIVDLLLQIIKEVQGGALKENLYGWLTEQQLVKRLIHMLEQPEESDKHNSIAEFLCELIKHCRSMRQTEQEGDSFESSFVMCNPLLMSIEDEQTISLLLDIMLQSEAKESTIISGISIVLTLVDESIVDEPASDKALQNILDKEKEKHQKIVSTVIKAMAPRLRDFHELLISPPKKKDVVTATTIVSPPFGITRLQVCRLFTVLLKTGHNEILNAICKTEFFNTLLKLFKQYRWNNFLHSEVEKCFECIFLPYAPNAFNQMKIEDSPDNFTPTALQNFVIVNCRIIPKLIDCWMHNREVQSSKSGRRLGYMGHLIKILKTISECIADSEQIRALIVSNLSNDELENWLLIMDEKIGELTKEINTQNQWLAKCNAYESAEYSVSLPKEFYNEDLSEYFNTSDIIRDDIEFHEMSSDLLNKLSDFETFFCKNSQKTNVDPWANSEAFDLNKRSSTEGEISFVMDDFADFDSHFSSFANDLGNMGSEQSDGNVNDQKEKKEISELDFNESNIEKCSPNENIYKNANEVHKIGDYKENGKDFDFDDKFGDETSDSAYENWGATSTVMTSSNDSKLKTCGSSNGGEVEHVNTIAKSINSSNQQQENHASEVNSFGEYAAHDESKVQVNCTNETIIPESTQSDLPEESSSEVSNSLEGNSTVENGSL